MSTMARIQQRIDYVMGLVLVGAFTFVERYTGIPSLMAMVFSKILSAGFCSAMTPTLAVVRVLLYYYLL
jgi:hypothetical protein